jgi:hypothetical protein
VTTVPANDAGTGIECNPVTNAGCTGADACDVNFNTAGTMLIGFVCYTPQGTAFTDTLCSFCDNSSDDLSCPAGQTCVPYGPQAAMLSACAQYCCTDADCGTGKCTTKDSTSTPIFSIAPTLGICTP